MNLVDALPEMAKLWREWGTPHSFEPGWDDWGNPRTNPNKRHCEALYGVEHWTASPSTATSYIIAGRPGLPMLANVHLLRDGRLHITSGFYANHAGYVDKNVATKLLRGDAPMDRDMDPGIDWSPDNVKAGLVPASYSANGAAIGLEGNAGPGYPYTPAQHDSANALWAAATIVLGWRRDVPFVGAHKEFSGRKPGDPSHPIYQRRRSVAAYIALKEDNMPTPKEIAEAILSHPIERAKLGGTTTLASEVAWMAANQAAIAKLVGEQSAHVDAAIATVLAEQKAGLGLSDEQVATLAAALTTRVADGLTIAPKEA